MKSSSGAFLALDLLAMCQDFYLDIDIATFFIASKVSVYENPYSFEEDI
jgi:hypothetical protein